MLWAVLFVPCGCDRSTPAEAQELARLAQAVDRLQESDNSSKGRWLDLLEQQQCRRFCDLRERCVEGFRLHVDALAKIQETRRGANAAPVNDLERAREQLRTALPVLRECIGLISEAKLALREQRAPGAER